jgi:hypothetical protein
MVLNKLKTPFEWTELRDRQPDRGGLHRSIIFTGSRRFVALTMTIESFLRGRHIGIITLPDLQSMLLKRTDKRKRHGPR